MKSRAPLILMELLVMILIFSLACACCLRLFAEAEHLSRRTQLQDSAVLLAQNAAELLKAGKTPETNTKGFVLNIRSWETEFPGLYQAEIEVACEGETLYTLAVGYREVGR